MREQVLESLSQSAIERLRLGKKCWEKDLSRYFMTTLQLFRIDNGTGFN